MKKTNNLIKEFNEEISISFAIHGSPNVIIDASIITNTKEIMVCDCNHSHMIGTKNIEQQFNIGTKLQTNEKVFYRKFTLQ